MTSDGRGSIGHDVAMAAIAAVADRSTGAVGLADEVELAESDLIGGSGVLAVLRPGMRWWPGPGPVPVREGWIPNGSGWLAAPAPSPGLRGAAQ